MAIKVKPKKPPHGAGRSKKKMPARLGKKARVQARRAGAKPATPTKAPLARKPPRKARTKKLFVHEAPHVESKKSVVARKPKPPREFVVAAEPVAAHILPHKKKKKKNQTVLRFTENTLKDIAALECVRRCFR